MTNYYLSPNGDGNGLTLDKPSSIALLADNEIPAGSTVYLRHGVYGENQFPWVPDNFLLSDGATTYINHLSAPELDDLGLGEFTAEAWIRADSVGENNSGMIFMKGLWYTRGWMIRMDALYAIYARMERATSAAYSRFSSGAFDTLIDGEWHHLAAYWKNGGDYKIHLAWDGIWGSSEGYQTQQTGSGDPVADDGDNLWRAAEDNTPSRSFDGGFGWYRISSGDRYGGATQTNFDPSHEPPSSDGTTLLLCYANEGTGTTIDNEQGDAGRDGTITNGSWGTSSPIAFDIDLLGTLESPINVRPYPGEHVIIDGEFDLKASGGYTHFHELEITSTSTLRTVPVTGRAGAFIVGDSPGYKLINCVIHDVGHPPIGPTGYESGIEIYGCVFYYNGIYDSENSDNPRGTVIYGQGGEIGANQHLVEDCISFKNWIGGMKCYGEAAYVKNWKFLGVCSFDNPDTQIFIDTTTHPVENVLIDSCYFRIKTEPVNGGYRGGTELGYPGHAEGADIILKDSILWSVLPDSYHNAPLKIFDWSDLTVTGNKIIATSDPGNTVRTLISYYNEAVAPTIDYDENEYYGNSFYLDGVGEIDFADWKTNTGFDVTSSQADGLPATNDVVVRANRYKNGRANIYIFNYEDLNSVSVDVSEILSVGDTYLVRDVENYYGTPVLQEEYSGGTISIPMTGTDLSEVIGEHDHLTSTGVLAHSEKDFGVFVLERVTEVTQDPPGNLELPSLIQRISRCSL